MVEPVQSQSAPEKHAVVVVLRASLQVEPHGPDSKDCRDELGDVAHQGHEVRVESVWIDHFCVGYDVSQDGVLQVGLCALVFIKRHAFGLLGTHDAPCFGERVVRHVAFSRDVDL